VLLTEAEQWAADCVSVGTRGLNGLERLMLGSVSTAVASPRSLFGGNRPAKSQTDLLVGIREAVPIVLLTASYVPEPEHPEKRQVMLIREMSQEEYYRVLAGARLARIACAHENQPYIVPAYLAFYQPSNGEPCLYGFTTLGQKVTWMRTNPLVSVEVDKVTASDQWMSIIVIGRYEELPENPADSGLQGRAPERAENLHRDCDDQGICESESELAWHILKTNPMWQEPGYSAWAARAHRDSAMPIIPIFYRIRIDSVTGHEAGHGTKDSISYAESASVPLGDKN
jgi:nitroimidazol reductase NimA-like FMN-containing flavoprotein (pyridoxamine 5'-phosphate oxidase superfamily)